MAIVKKNIPNISIEGARIGFRNFAGKEGKYNAKGNRNFCLFLDNDLADKLTEDGWNVRWLQPRDEGDTPQAYLSVNVKFGDYPPKITMITSRGQTLLDEESVDVLDWAEIATVDLIVRPYTWEISGKQGVKGYLKSLYIQIVENEFEKKWANGPIDIDSNDESY